MDRVQEIRKLYGRLKAMHASIPITLSPQLFGDDYSRIVGALAKLLEDDLSEFQLGHLRIYGNRGDSPSYYSDELKLRVSQLIGLLEHGYNVADKTIEIGSLYNAIRDVELRERCGDLLTAPGNFDRVINQATLVLEDRIRRRTGSEKTLVGASLVNANVKADPNASVIVFSDVQTEQEGYANILRGLMQALRNETHHHVVDTFSREDALSVCGFIDRILRLIDQAVVKK